MNTVKRTLLAILLGIVIAAFASLIGGILVWLLWNAVVPAVFGLPALTYIQAFLLTWLCSCLFKTSVSTKE